MTIYHITRDPERGRHLYIRIRFQTEGAEKLRLELPNWRPGRYELANYARNVVGFSAQLISGQPLGYSKRSRLIWEIETAGAQEIVVSYSYYANQPDAGACWADDQLLYINPVNCLFYTVAARKQPCLLSLGLLPGEKTATGLTRTDDGHYAAGDFDELADSPLLCSAHLLHHAFQVDDVAYHIWFYGLQEVPWEKVVGDFIAYTKVQHQLMGDLPVKEYHYLNLILPFKFYHGVEHHNSTVIALGPAEEVFTTQYSELLGVSSHELFHTWNVKFIKPEPFAPYEYNQENYSPLGYVYEGFTTYYGDLFLHRAGVFDWQAYAGEVDAYLKRHFDNYGRFNHGLHESSIDTWVDGYGGPAAPNRRVSIYAEGMLNALILDLRIRQLTHHEKSLDDLMRALYDDAKKGKCYNEDSLILHLQKMTGQNFEPFFEKHYRHPISLEYELVSALELVGCTLKEGMSPDLTEAWLGVRGTDADGWRTVTAIAPGSPAARAGLMVEDKLKLEGLDKPEIWANGHQLSLVWTGRMLRERTEQVLLLTPDYFKNYLLVRLETLNEAQVFAFRRWTQ